MIALLWLVLAALGSRFKSKGQLEAESIALRHQVMVLRRQARGRIRLTNLDRLFLVQLYRWFPAILQVLGKEPVFAAIGVGSRIRGEGDRKSMRNCAL
ncbi:MAG: hypothetical protein P8Y71_10025 [Pseudolabrys sp.]